MAVKSNNILSHWINIALASFILFLQGWIADGIKGDELFPWLPAGKLTPGEPRFLEGMLVMTLLALLCALLLYLRRRSFLPPVVQRIGQPGHVNPHAVLVLSISWPRWQWNPAQLTGDRGRRVDLPSSLPGALVAMAALPRQEQFPWEQLLRAIQEHLPRLQRLILIGSSGEGGTAASFDACRKMICHYFPSLDAAAIEKRVAHFEALDDLLQVYGGIIAAASEPKGEIMIDVTGGTKVVSIAAAMVTLEHPEIEFQYMETEGAKQVRAFNVLSGNESRNG